MLCRTILNGVRGMVGGGLAYPLAEWVERRNISGARRQLAAEMALPFVERRRRSWRTMLETVRFAAAHVPYYADLFARIGIDADRLAADPHRFAEIPYLTKDIIRTEGDRLLRRDHAAFAKHRVKTGGSTGPSTHIVYDQEAADWSSAVTRLARETIGHRQGHAEAHFASRFPERFPLRDRLREQVKGLAQNRSNVFYAGFAADELERIWRRLRSLRPHLVHAHPSTMFHLARHVAARHGSAKAFDIFESSGERLGRQQRQTIAGVLCCDVVDRYGLAEIGVAAYQFERSGTAMRMFDPFVWPEIASVEWEAELPRAPAARSGELVVTALRNRMMPLIRYRTGDMAVLSEDADGFTIHEMVGRTHDVIAIGDRQLPTHYVQDVLDRIGGIQEFQIECAGRAIILRLLAEPEADREGIRNRIGAWWPDDVAVEFVEPEAFILQGWRAKFRHLAPSRALESVS